MRPHSLSMKTFLSLLLALCVVSSIDAQQVTVYADTTSRDTLRKLVTIIEEQLGKVRPVSIDVRPLRLYKGNGICLVKRSSDRNSKLRSTSKLAGKGVEAFSLSSQQGSVEIAGNSDMAVGHGVFTWLEAIGFRYYFPHPDWHITPASLNLFPKISIISSPSFLHRRIFYGYGTGSVQADKEFVFWQLANKMGGSLNAIFGHAYDDIVARNTAVFKEHPEWFWPVPKKGDLPENPKFDMSNEQLVQFVIADAFKRVETSIKNGTQAYKMITMGPSDGNGTCNSPACQRLGTMTDRVYYLVNRVAKALRTKFPRTLVGCLAYTEYIEPPTIRVEPNVYVSITTAFNNSNYSTEQLVDLWKKKGPLVGIYDYFSWFAWDQDVPGQSLVSRTRELERTIRQYHKKGVVGYDGESSIGWVSKGLGYFLVSKLMWNVKFETTAIRNEFFKLNFGNASAAMTRLWNDWENYGFTQPRESDLARWIDSVLAAKKLETDSRVQKRFYHIESYLHYLFLLRNYQLAKTESNLLALLSYGYRMLDYGSVSGYPAFFELGNRSGIAGMGWGKDAKWRINSTPPDTREMTALLTADRSKLVVAKEVKHFANPSKYKNVPLLSKYQKILADSNNADNAFWFQNEWVFEIKKTGSQNYIEFTGDFLADKTNNRPIKIDIYSYAPDGNVAGRTPLFTYRYTMQKVKYLINLGKFNPGYYTMIIEDPVKTHRMKFSPVINYSVVMRPARHLKTTSLNYAFIYVPEGVTRFNVIKSRVVNFITPAGRTVNLSNDREEDIQVEVKPGEAGLWRIKLLADRLFIEGIPPYLSTSARQMLIPEGY